jgi:hypothetical protein
LKEGKLIESEVNRIVNKRLRRGIGMCHQSIKNSAKEKEQVLEIYYEIFVTLKL